VRIPRSIRLKVSTSTPRPAQPHGRSAGGAMGGESGMALRRETPAGSPSPRGPVTTGG
jgi:hypothetical protein